jgi:hypothetical protein
MAYQCTTCGQLHDGLPDIGVDKPDHWWDVPEGERGRRVVWTPDTCVIDGEHHFIRGVIEIPVHDHPEAFGLGVWVSQKRENFLAYVGRPDSAAIGPFFGWLCTRVSYYPDTLLLKASARFRGGRLRPAVVLEPTDHPLAVDQREGIRLAKAWEIVHHYMK